MQQFPLGAAEKELDRRLRELTQEVLHGSDRLSNFDVTAPPSQAKVVEEQLLQHLRRFKSLLADLVHAANEQERPEEIQTVEQCAAFHQRALESARGTLQQARVRYKLNVERHQEQQRRELIGSVDFSQRQQKFAREQDVLTASEDITATLRRTKQLMDQNLEQTHGNISVLGAGNKRLQAADDELTGHKALYKDAHKQQRTLQKQSWMDRWAMYIGFAFFLLCVGYISVRRTPAFIKQPVYALLHMKQSGEPFTHSDYASVNIPPEMLKPSQQSWGGSDGRLPPEWEAWDSNFEGDSGPEHGTGAFQDAEWLDAEQHEPVGRTGGQVWRRGQQGELLEDMYSGPGTPRRENEAPHQPGYQQHDQGQHAPSGECSAADHATSECSNSPDAHAQHQAHPDSADAFDSWDQWQRQQQAAADAAGIGGREPELPPPPAPAPVPLHEEGAPVDVTSHHPPQEQQGSQHGQHQQQPAGNQGGHADFEGPEYFDDGQDDGAEDHWGLDDGSLPVPAEPVRSPGDGHHWQPPAPTAAGIVDPDAAAEGAGQHRQHGTSGQPAGEGAEGFDEDPDELEYWKQQREAEQEAERLHFEQQLAAAAAAEREREQAQAAEQQQQQQQQDAAGHQEAAHMQHEHEVPPQQHEAQHDTWSEPVHRLLQHDDAQYEAEQQQQHDAQDEPVQYQQPQQGQAHDEHHHQQQLGEEDREQVWQEAQQQQQQQEPMPHEQQEQPPQQDPHHKARGQTPQWDQHGGAEQHPPPQQQQHHDYDEAQWELLKGHEVQMPDDAQIEPVSPEHEQQQQQQDHQGAPHGQADEQQQQELEQRQAPEHHWEQHGALEHQWEQQEQQQQAHDHQGELQQHEQAPEHQWEQQEQQQHAHEHHWEQEQQQQQQQPPEHQWEQQEQQAHEVAAQHGQLQDEAPAPDAMAPQQHEAQQQPQVPGEHAMQHEQQIHAPDAAAHPDHAEAPLHAVDGHQQQQGQEQEHWQQADQWQHQQEVQQEADRRALEQQQEQWQHQEPMEQIEVHPAAAPAPSDVEHAAAEVVHQAAEAAAAASEAAREQAAVLEEAARLHDAAAAAQEQQQPADMDGFGMPDEPAAPQQPAAGFDHEAMQQEEPRAAVHPTELEQQHREDAAAAPHQEPPQAPEHHHQQPPHMAEQLAALQAQLAAAEQEAAAAEADVLPGLASGHDDMGQQQAQQHHHEGPAEAEEHPSHADPSVAQERGAAAPPGEPAGEPLERHIAAEQEQQQEQEPALHAAAPEQHPAEQLEQEHADEVYRRHLADQQQYHKEDLHEQPAVDSWEEPAASLQHPQDEQHVAPAQQPHEEPTVEPPVAVDAEEPREPPAAAAPGDHHPGEAVMQEEAPVGGEYVEEPPTADQAAVEAPAPAAQEVPQQQVPQQEVQAADQGYYDMDADGDYAGGLSADGAHVPSDGAQPEVEQPTKVQADMAGSPAAAEPVVPADAAKAPQQPQRQQPDQELERATAPVAQPAVGRPVDLPEGPAAAIVVGFKQKASDLKAKLDDHAVIVKPAPKFEMPPPGADDEEEEGDVGQVAAALSNLFNWVKGGIPKAPSPILPVAAAAQLNLELRPLEGSEHFFDEPYNDYYFYYDEADGSKGKGGQAGATGGKAGVHARPSTKAPAAAQQYQPYDDPEDNTDELDYDAAELFLGGDSSSGADGGQQSPSQGGKESQKRQQQGTTAEL